MNQCKFCKGLTSLRRYRNLDYEDHCYADGRMAPKEFICQTCLESNASEYGFCEDCGDQIVYDSCHLKTVMYEGAKYCPEHASRYDESSTMDDDEETDAQDLFDYISKDD